MNVYTIHDITASYFMAPFYARTHAEAQRSFEQAVKDKSSPNNLMAQYPDQYALHHIGSFDEATGTLTSVVPSRLGIGSDYVQS